MILAEATFRDIWPIIATVVGIASGICSGAIWFSMQSLKDSNKATADKQQAADRDIASIRERLGTCRLECDRNTVSKEDWVREVGYSRRLQEQQIREMAEIKTLVNKMPEITGQIIRSVVAEMKRG
jgi:hypothetical protein